MRVFLLLLILYSLCFKANANATKSIGDIRVGVLKYGTVNWEIDVIKHHQLDKKHNFNLQITPLSNKNASAVALQSNAVDLILGDWLWVNRQRFNGKNYSLFPTSIASGGLYIDGKSAINSLEDLKHAKIGIAGGAVDKNWLLLQAYAKKIHQIDIKNNAELVFATPPLLNRLIQRGNVDSAINFWHYNARLSAKGYRLLISVPEMLSELGISGQVPLLGWVFDQKWATEQSVTLSAFLAASNEAKQRLLLCDNEWERIRILTKAENDNVFNALKNEYRNRLLTSFSTKEINTSKQVFTILAEQGGRDLVGKATTLAEQTFWQPSKANLNFSDNRSKNTKNSPEICALQ